MRDAATEGMGVRWMVKGGHGFKPLDAGSIRQLLPSEADPAKEDTTRPDCSALPAQLPDERERSHWLELAARAGVRGALLAWIDRGPFGDPSALWTRPADLLVRQWVSQVRTLALEQVVAGDLQLVEPLTAWAAQAYALREHRAALYEFIHGLGQAAAVALMASDEPSVAHVQVQSQSPSIDTTITDFVITCHRVFDLDTQHTRAWVKAVGNTSYIEHDRQSAMFAQGVDWLDHACPTPWAPSPTDPQGRWGR
jgi:hypothetical protein